MKKLLLLAAIFVLTLPVFAQNSTTMLGVRQSNTGVLTIQQIPTPATYGVLADGCIDGNDFVDLITSDITQDGGIPLGTEGQSFLWTFLEHMVIKYPGQPFPLNNQGLMIVIYQRVPNITVLCSIHEDPSLTGPYVAFTSSLSTAENAIRDKLYLGL